MSFHGSIHLFLKKKYTYKGIHRLFKTLNLDDFSLSPIQKSYVYNGIDLRLYEGRLNFTIEGKELNFMVKVEEYEGNKGTNDIELQFKASDITTYDCVYDSDDFFSIFKKMKYLEGIALIGNDETAPTDNYYSAFKNGDFDIYLQPLGVPFSSTFHFDAWRRYLEKQNSMTGEQIQAFIQELKDKWS